MSPVSNLLFSFFVIFWADEQSPESGILVLTFKETKAYKSIMINQNEADNNITSLGQVYFDKVSWFLIRL